MVEKNKNLNLARAAVGEGNFKEAKGYYKIVFEEMPENLEAEWFYLFSSVTEEVNKETANNYTRLVEIFHPTLKYVAALEESDEKWVLACAIVKGFLPLGDILHDAMIRVLARDRSAFPLEDASKVSMETIKVNKQYIADDIIDIFGEEKPYCMLAVDIWKEMIAERFKWSPYRNFQDRGKELWFDELAKKIKKYDSSYEMPQFKQAGCISTGDAAKVTPGK